MITQKQKFGFKPNKNFEFLILNRLYDTNMKMEKLCSTLNDKIQLWDGTLLWSTANTTPTSLSYFDHRERPSRRTSASGRLIVSEAVYFHSTEMLYMRSV